MDTARASIGGDVDAVAAIRPGRETSVELHKQSEHAQLIVLLCGLVALVGMRDGRAANLIPGAAQRTTKFWMPLIRSFFVNMWVHR